MYLLHFQPEVWWRPSRIWCDMISWSIVTSQTTRTPSCPFALNDGAPCAVLGISEAPCMKPQKYIEVESMQVAYIGCYA